MCTSISHLDVLFNYLFYISIKESVGWLESIFGLVFAYALAKINIYQE